MKSIKSLENALVYGGKGELGGKPEKQSLTSFLGFKDGFNTIFRIQKQTEKCQSAAGEIAFSLCHLQQFCMEGQRSTKVSFYSKWAKF